MSKTVTGGSPPKRLSPAAQPGHHAGRRPANAGRRFPVEILKPGEISAILEACSPTSSTGIRNRALITVLYRTGVRLAEALALFEKDIDLGSGTLAVLQGKGGRRRTVGLDAGAIPAL